MAEKSGSNQLLKKVLDYTGSYLKRINRKQLVASYLANVVTSRSKLSGQSLGLIGWTTVCGF